MPFISGNEYQDVFENNPNRTLYTANEICLKGINTFGWQHGKHKDGEDIPWHFHKDCFEFHYMIHGNLSFIVDDHEYIMKDGDVFVTFPNELHRSGTIMLRRMYWFSLSDTNNILNLNPEWSNYLISGLYKLKNRIIPVGSEMEDLLKSIYQNIGISGTGHELYTSLQMASFIYKLIEYDRILAERSVSKEITGAICFIEQNKHRNISLEEVAQNSNLSLSHFKRRFKTETGNTPSLYIQKKRIERAEEMLKNGHSITETAYALDFCSSNYFSVVFRRIKLMTPSEYKKLYNNGVTKE